MDERELSPGLTAIVRLMRLIDRNLDETFMLGEQVDTFTLLSLSAEEEYVFEVMSIESRESAGFEEWTHRLTLSYRRVGQEESLYSVEGSVKPNGMYSALEVLHESPEALEMSEFGNQVGSEIAAKWPEKWV